VSDLEALGGFPYCGHSALTGKVRRDWQDTQYVLGYFGKTHREARRNYLAYMREGVNQGRRPELTGGGLIRSLGGWTEIKKKRRKGPYRIKGDERILGETDFVLDVLSQAEEKLKRSYELKRKGYDLQKVAERVSEIFRIDPSEIISRGRRKDQVLARDLFCYWVVRELDYSITEVARFLGMTPSGVGYSVQRGKAIIEEKGYRLEE